MHEWKRLKEKFIASMLMNDMKPSLCSLNKCRQNVYIPFERTLLIVIIGLFG